MSSPNNPQDPYGSPEDRDRSSGSGSNPPPYGSTPPAYGSQPDDGSTPPPPAYGSQPDYGSAPPAYGGGYGGSASPYDQGGYGYPKNSLGVWALVLGLVAFFLCGPLAGIPAIIVGSMSRKAAARGEANNGGLGLAGLVLGWVSVVLSILALVLFFTVFGGIAGYTEFIESNSGTTTTF